MRTSTVKFSVAWREDAPHRAPEERATFADLLIELGGLSATLHNAQGQAGDSICLPLYGIAEGLALDWWRLFGSREGDLSLKRYRSGYAFPDLRMRFDGADFEIRALQSVYTNPDVRFWIGQTETLSRAEAEAALGSFVDAVLERLGARNVTDTTASLRWAQVRASLADPEERAFCEAAAALGEDPYRIDDATAATVQTSAQIFADEALMEFLAGMRGKDRARLLQWIATARANPGYSARLDDLPDLARQVADAVPERRGDAGWALGYRRARAFRSALGFGDSGRIRSEKALARHLGNRDFRARAAVDGIRALRQEDDRGVLLHLRKSTPSDQLFSFARGVGDVACFPLSGNAAVNDVQHAHRQSCGRAFAAELLAPVRSVRAMADEGRDNLTIATEFGVSERVVEHQLENASRIERVCA